MYDDLCVVCAPFATGCVLRSRCVRCINCIEIRQCVLSTKASNMLLFVGFSDFLFHILGLPISPAHYIIIIYLYVIVFVFIHNFLFGYPAEECAVCGFVAVCCSMFWWWYVDYMCIFCNRLFTINIMCRQSNDKYSHCMLVCFFYFARWC